MAKILYYEVANHGRFQDDSDDGFGCLYFEKLKDAESFARDNCAHYAQEDNPYVVSKMVGNTWSDTRGAIVDALNRNFHAAHTELFTIDWDGEKVTKTMAPKGTPNENQ